MVKYLMKVLTAVVMLSLVRAGADAHRAALPVEATADLSRAGGALAEAGAYTEDFTTYTAKGYGENAEWDIWMHALRLSRLDGIGQYSYKVAAGESDNMIVVWEDTRSGSWDIYAQKLDASGNRLWAADVRVNSDSGDAPQEYPAVATDGSGNAVIVWRDSRNGDADIYAQRLDISGNKLWAADVRINSDNGTAFQECPAVAVDGSGNAVVVWTDNRNGNDDVYAQRLDTNGNRVWAMDIRVNADSMATYQRNPAVAMDGDGSTIVVWEDSRGGWSSIYAQRLNVSGSRLWSLDVEVALGSETSLLYNPAVAVDGSGNAVIAWESWQEDIDIYAQRLDAGGNKLWAADVRVSEGRNPDVAMAASGDAIIAWTGGDIYAQKLSGSGLRLWAVGVKVNSDNGTVGKVCPAVAVNRSNNAVVVWGDGRNGNLDVYAQRLDTGGTKLWVVDVRANSDSGAVLQGWPDVAVDWSGNTIAVWTDGRNIDQDVYIQRIDIRGNKVWATDVRVNSDNGTAFQGCPAVAVDGSGNAVVVWMDNRNGNYDIYAQRLDANGNRMWATDVRVNSYSGTKDHRCPDIALDGSGNVIVVWADNYWDVYAQKLDGRGSKLWAMDVHVDTGVAYQLNPAVAADQAGNAVIVWENYALDAGTYAQRLDAGGNKLWAADVRVSEGRNPDVAMAANSNAVIVWRDYRNGNADIYAQQLDVNGNHLWETDVRVNSDSGTADQEFPVIISEEGSWNAIVGWQDSRNGNHDVYAQKLNQSGNRLWGTDVQVNIGGGAANRKYPVMAIDESGNTVVAWMEDTDGNEDVFAQRINTIGGNVWLADLQVVYPDRFYFLTGTAQSRTVDTVISTIRSATLTADYQANGGGVQFYLTNDGGAHWITATLGTATVFTTTGSDLRWRAILSVDPIWQRTPVVNSLRIEYSTQPSYADDYEPDDICAQVQPIQVNGAAQAHTFHQDADADWAWFNVTSVTTYVVQTSNTQASADTMLELRAACPQPPLDSGDNAFGNDARITWQASFSGPVYVKVANHTPSVYGPDTGYDLSVRTFTQPPVAVIVGGHDDGYRLQANIDHAADMAYLTFLNSGVPKANLRYFGPNPHRDVDSNGLNDDIYATVTLTGVREAVQDWSRAQGVQLGVPFYVYLVDHGHYDQFMAAGASGKITATDLNLWLSNLEATSGTDNVNVILEACYSGSFIDVTDLGPAEVSGRNRVVIASTSSGLNAYPSVQGAYFSDAFWTALGQNQDLKTAFEAAKQAVQATGLSQQPWLDDNGDAVADGRDGALARSRGLGSPFAGSPPAIDWVRMGPVSGGQATVVAQVRDDFGVAGVWAVVYPPDFVEPEPTQDGTTPALNVPTTTLTLAGRDLYSTAYRGFTQTGQYRLVVYAEDADGNQAMPQSVGVCAGCVYLPLVVRSH